MTATKQQEKLLKQVETTAAAYRKAMVVESDTREAFSLAVNKAVDGGVKIADVVDVSGLSRQTIWNVRR